MQRLLPSFECEKQNLDSSRQIFLAVPSIMPYSTVCMWNHTTSTLFQKLRGGAGSKRYGLDFFVHMNEKKKIREIITVYGPGNGKIHSILL